MNEEKSQNSIIALALIFALTFEPFERIEPLKLQKPLKPLLTSPPPCLEFLLLYKVPRLIFSWFL